MKKKFGQNHTETTLVLPPNTNNKKIVLVLFTYRFIALQFLHHLNCIQHVVQSAALSLYTYINQLLYIVSQSVSQ